MSKKYLPFASLMRITDALGDYYRTGNQIFGTASGTVPSNAYLQLSNEIKFFGKVCELVTIDQSGTNGVYTIRHRDLVNGFAVGRYVTYWDSSEKRIYSTSGATYAALPIVSIDRSAGTITTTGKFSSAPGATDFLVLLADDLSSFADDLTDYVIALADDDQVNDLLAAVMGVRENLKTANAVHPMVRQLVDALGNHYQNGINAQLENHTNPVISTPTNTTNATVDVPDDFASFFTAADYVTYYDTSAGYRILKPLAVTSVGAAGSGTTSGTTLITLTGTWTVAPVAGDYLMIYDRVCPEFKLICDSLGIDLTAGRVFPQETYFGNYVATNASSGTFTLGNSVNTDEYGGADLEVEVLSLIGGNNLVLTMTGAYYDAAGTLCSDTGLTCTVTAASAIGTRFAVTPGVANARYHSISAITNSNGTAADTVKIVTKLDRLIRRN